MRVAEAIHQKLSKALSPEHLEVNDDSHKHAGHAGANPDGESHFNVTVVTSRFDGLSRIQRQRLVYEALSEEMKGPIHALQLQTWTPDEKKNK